VLLQEARICSPDIPGDLGYRQQRGYDRQNPRPRHQRLGLAVYPIT
jgi:hypothetical protein